MKETDYIKATNARSLSIACDVLRGVLILDDKAMAELDDIRAKLARMRDRAFAQIKTTDDSRP